MKFSDSWGARLGEPCTATVMLLFNPVETQTVLPPGPVGEAGSSMKADEVAEAVCRTVGAWKEVPQEPRKPSQSMGRNSNATFGSVVAPMLPP